MSGRQDHEALVIHPKSLALVGDEVCLEMLAIARDLRTGVIPPAADAIERFVLDGSDKPWKV